MTAFLLSVLTDSETALIKELPCYFHVAVGRLAGVTSVVAPFAVGFTDLDAWYHQANGPAVLTATVLLAAPTGATEGRPSLVGSA